MAARAAGKLAASTVFDSIVGGAIDIGAATPFVAPLCIALQKGKGMVDRASRNKQELNELLNWCWSITVQVINKIKALETSTIDVTLLLECVFELQAVAERRRGQGRCSSLMFSHRDGDDIQRLRTKIKGAERFMALAIGVELRGEIDQMSANLKQLVADVAGTVTSIRFQHESEQKHALARKVKVLGAPRIKTWHVQRRTQIERACYLLGINTEDTAAQEPRMVGLVGPGGAGKSTAASMIINKVDVWEHFHKGVMWLPVGKGADSRLSELMFCLATMVWEIDLAAQCVRPPEKGGAVVEREDGARYIRKWVDEASRRSFLVVADDVWEKEVLTELSKAGVWVLYTSRHDALSEDTLWLNTISGEEAENVLRRAGELEEGQRLPDAAYDLVKRSNYCVMDLAFVARWSTVNRRIDAKAWQGAVDRIASCQEERGVSWRTAVLHAGYDELPTVVKDLYRSLAVLPKGLPFSVRVAAVLLYGSDYSEPDLASAARISATLERFSILTLEASGKYRVHDEHADFVRERIEKSPEHREQALGVWREYAGSKHAVFSWSERELVKIWREIDALQGTGTTRRPFASLLDGLEGSDFLVVLDRLVTFYDLRRQPMKAYYNAVEMLTLEENVLGPRNPRLVHTLECTGTCAKLAGLENEANKFFQRALAIQERAQLIRVDTPCPLNEEEQESSTIEDKEALLERNKAMRLDSLEPDHPNIAITYCQLGVGALRAGNAEKAEGSLQQAYRICETQGADSIEITRPLHWFGVLHLETGRIDSAEDYLKRALEIRELRLGPDHQDVADTVHALGQCARIAGRERKAVQLFLRALRIREYSEEPATVQNQG